MIEEAKVVNPILTKYDLNTAKGRALFNTYMISQGITEWSYDFASKELLIKGEAPDPIDKTKLAELGKIEPIKPPEIGAVQAVAVEEKRGGQAMTIYRGETMNALIGTRHECNITYPTFDEAAGGTVGLPASEPATAQISYTVATATHLPVLDARVTYQNTGFVMASGLNLTTAANVLSYRILKNTISLATGTLACVNSQYWTAHLYNAGLNGLVNGDLIEIKLWTTATSLIDWRWNGFAVVPTRIKPFNDTRRIALNVQYTDGNVKYPVATLGGLPFQYTVVGGYVYGTMISNSATTIAQTSNNCAGLQKEEATYGIYRNGPSDITTTPTIGNHATRNPYYATTLKLTKIQWNELDMRI